MAEQTFDRSNWSTSTLAEQRSCSKGDEDTSTTSSHEKAINAAGRSGKKARLDFTNVLEIRVGEEGCFLVPENRLTQRSEVFRDRYLQQAKGGEEIPVVDLPDEDRFLFDIYLQVVYQDEVVLPLRVDEAEDPHWCIIAMVGAYMLADKLKDKASSNIIVDSLIDFCSRHDLALESNDWNAIFLGNYKGSVLRKLAVDCCVMVTQPEFLKSQLRQMPAEMAIDCVARFADLRHDMMVQVTRDESPYAITSLSELDLCRHYHQHDESCPPCAKMAQESKSSDTPIRRRGSSAGSEKSSVFDDYYSA